MDEMQTNEKLVEALSDYVEVGPPGNLLTVIPGVIICLVTALLVFILAIGSDLLLPQEQRDEIQEKLHLYEITAIFVPEEDRDTSNK